MIRNNVQAQAFKGIVKFGTQTAETQTNWDGEIQKIFEKSETNGIISFRDQQEITTALRLSGVPGRIYNSLALYGKSVTTSQSNGTFTATVGQSRKPYLTFSCDA